LSIEFASSSMMLLDSGAGGAERTGGGGFDGFAGMTFRPAMVSQDETQKPLEPIES
jgi:hypothetical protein